MKNRKKNIKLILLVLILCITLGYAALRTGLNINGTTNVSSASWNVHFENYQMSNATNITPTTEPSISGTTTTSISYEINLEKPGDLYEFSVEVVNGGSLDANISLVSKYNGSEIGPGNQIPAYIDYTVTDGNGDPIVDNHRLNHGSRETVKVFVKYKDNDPSILPSSETTLSFDIEIEATQAEKIVTKYAVSTTEGVINNPVPQGLTLRDTREEAIEDWKDITLDQSTRPFYIKYEIDHNNNIVGSYLETIISDDIATSNPGMTAGTYTLTYGVAQLSHNTDLIKGIFDYENHSSRCNDTTSVFRCGVEGVGLVANSDGGVTAYTHGGDGACFVSRLGAAGCHN